MSRNDGSPGDQDDINTTLIPADIQGLLTQFLPTHDVARLAALGIAPNGTTYDTVYEETLGRADVRAVDLVELGRLPSLPIQTLQNARTLPAQLKILLDNALNKGCHPSVIAAFAFQKMRHDLDVMDTIDSELFDSELFIILASYLSEKNISALYYRADTQLEFRDLSNRKTACTVLQALAPHMTAPQIGVVLSALQARLAESDCRVRESACTVLQALAPHMTEPQIEGMLPALQTNLMYGGRDVRKAACAALQALAPRLTAQQIEDMLSALQTNLTNWDRAVQKAACAALQALAPRLTAQQKEQVSSQLDQQDLLSDYHKEMISAVISLSPTCVESVSSKDPLCVLIKRTMPFFVPKLPILSISKNKLLAGADAKHKTVATSVCAFNAVLCGYVLDSNAITTQQTTRQTAKDIKEKFDNLIRVICQKRKLQLPFFQHKPTTVEFSTHTDTATQLIAYFVSPESIVAREILCDFMKEHGFTSTDTTPFSISLQKYMKKITSPPKKSNSAAPATTEEENMSVSECAPT